jgi:hypothetical protein
LLDSLIERRKEVIDIVVEVTANTGVKAHDLFTKAKQLLKSQESDTHSSVISCLILYIWSSHRESKKRDLTLLAIQDYVLAESHAIPGMLRACKEGKSSNLHHGDFHTDAHSFPGCHRLDPMRNPLFDECWDDLAYYVIQILTYEAPSKTNIGCLETLL